MRISTLAAALFLAGCSSVSESPRPNVVLVMTDDQGFGDFGFAGNPVLQTPHLDRMAKASARLRNFYVHPVCTPTRAALMTGRHPQRTRAIDTWIGRAMMDPEETTVAEILQRSGWATGIFGKWHLGDCYPMRAMDQGFEESLVHRGGGIGQSSDPIGFEGRYTDPILFHNGVRAPQKGYCTDVYFDAAIAWMRKQNAAGRPFFTYLATNAPHGPFGDVPEELLAKYEAMDLGNDRYPRAPGHRLPEEPSKAIARIYAMIENIDQNIGKLHRALRAMDAHRETLVVFLVDNGPNTRRFVRGHKGMKTEVFEGGIRSPLLAYWPGRLEPGIASERIAAHYDLLPTILEACGQKPPEGLRLDGRSLWPLLTRAADAPWPDRKLYLQAHRGDRQVQYHHCVVRGPRFKLVHPSGFGREVAAVEPAFELYDLVADPFEENDLAAAQPAVVAAMRRDYEAWFADVTGTRPDLGTPPAIHLGAPQAPRVVLTRQDCQRLDRPGTGGRKSRGREFQGRWRVDVRHRGPYTVHVHGLPRVQGADVTLTVGDETFSGRAEARSCTFRGLELPTGIQHLQAELRDATGTSSAYQVHVERQ